MSIKEFLRLAEKEGKKLGLETHKIRVEFSVWNITKNEEPKIQITYYEGKKGETISAYGKTSKECLKKIKEKIGEKNEKLEELTL